MANIASARKAARQSEKRRVHNASVRHGLALAPVDLDRVRGASPYRRNAVAAIPSRQYGRSRGHGCQLA